MWWSIWRGKKTSWQCLWATSLGVCRATVWEWAKRRPGFPPAIKLSARVTVWDSAEVDAWVAQQR